MRHIQGRNTNYNSSNPNPTFGLTFIYLITTPYRRDNGTIMLINKYCFSALKSIIVDPYTFLHHFSSLLNILNSGSGDKSKENKSVPKSNYIVAQTLTAISVFVCAGVAVHSSSRTLVV